MRRSNKVFSAAERKGALWLVIGCLAVASAGALVDRLLSPSLGWYGQSGDSSPMEGFIEAQPLG